MGKETVSISFCGRYSVGINKFLLPIKISLFCWFAASRIVMMFIPVYLKHQGLTIKHYSIVVFISVVFQVFVSIISGILADKIGRIKPFLFTYLSVFLLTLVGFIIMPKVDVCSKNITFDCADEESFRFTARNFCRNFQDNFYVDACSVIQNGSNDYDQNLYCPFIFKLWQRNISTEKNNLSNTSSWCEYQEKSKNFSNADISSCDTQNCKLFQTVCSVKDTTGCNRNRIVWIFIYSILVTICFVSHTAAHRCLDVISSDISKRHNSDFGKQRLWSVLGTSAGPSLAGLILEKTTGEESGKKYTPIFVCVIVFVIFSVALVWNINSEFHRPTTGVWKKSLKLMKKPKILLFFLLVLTAGISFSFQINYGNWYLQSLGASDLLLGISKGIGTLCSLPFLHTSKWFFDKIGLRSFFVIGLLCYTLYSFAFALMIEPWLAMVFELANIFAYALFWPAVIQFCEEIAPVELQATIKFLAGVLHFNAGNMGASMIGGYVMNNYGGRMAYQTIGYICSGYAAIYGMHLILEYLRKKKTGPPVKCENCEMPA